MAVHHVVPDGLPRLPLNDLDELRIRSAHSNRDPLAREQDELRDVLERRGRRVLEDPHGRGVDRAEEVRDERVVDRAVFGCVVEPVDEDERADVRLHRGRERTGRRLEEHRRKPRRGSHEANQDDPARVGLQGAGGCAEEPFGVGDDPLKRSFEILEDICELH